LTALSDEQDRPRDDSKLFSDYAGDPINLSSKSLEVSNGLVGKENGLVGKENGTAVGSKIGEQPSALPVSVMSPTNGIQTLQTPCYGACNNLFPQRSDTTILAIVLGLISLGLLGLAFALVKRRD
jgi:hypothetical protein